LAATAGATQVNLQWTNSTGTRTGFHVQQSLDGLAWATVATITNPAATTAAVSGLTPNKTYSFRVTAYNDSGDSAGSNVATASIYRLAGDANSDGIVDQADYTLWYNSYGAAGTWAQGDFNGDSLVDQADYTLWYNGYGSSTVYGSGGSAPTGDSIGETGAMAAIVTQDAAPTLLVAAAASQQQLVANNRPLPALGLLDSVATSDGLELLDVLALTSLRSAV